MNHMLLALIPIWEAIEISQEHLWIVCDGSKLETNTKFPPYKGIMVGEARNSSKAIPLVLKDYLMLGIDGTI